jgi:colicin import membrane protein
MIGLAVFVALVAVLTAVALLLQSRSARKTAVARTEDLERVTKEYEAVKNDLAPLRTEVKERRDEANALKAELNATKRKAFEQAEASRKAGGAPALRTEIDKLTTRLAEARAEAAHHLERAKTIETALDKQTKEAERLRVLAERKPEPPPPPAAAPPAAPAGADPALLAVEKERADKAETKLAEARRRIAEVEKDLKGVRGRLETEKRVYMVQKGELELAGDRNAELRRRYDALRKDHEELLEAVRQAAQEDRRLSEAEKKVKAEAQAPVEKA